MLKSTMNCAIPEISYWRQFGVDGLTYHKRKKKNNHNNE